jgi:Tol biopolymer transport system component
MTKDSYVRHIPLLVALLVMLAILMPLPCYSASIDPSFRFSTIETDHFTIHFHQGLEMSAYRAADILEDVHNTLTENFQWTPQDRTQVVLLDNTDFANGLATVLPYNAMYINLSPPFPDLTISESDDWLEIVLIHEYVHILTLDPVRGYSSDLRKIFGKTIPGNDPLSSVLFFLTAPPNIFLPDWWVEGIATWAETEYTSSGRGRSSIVDMIFRMAVLEDKIPEIDRLNGDVPYWPSGSTPYIYGMLFKKYIADTYGRELPGKLNSAHSGRLPFFINHPPKKLTGLSYIELYREAVKNLMIEQTHKIEVLKARDFTEVIELPVTGERITNPRVSPLGRYLAVNRRDPHDHETIVIYDFNTFDEISRVRRMPSDHSLSWSPDGRRLYFTQAAKKNSYNLYQDMYVFNIKTKSVEQITSNLRAKDIDISPEGSRIVFVKTETGRQNIAVLTLEDGSTRNVTDYDGQVLSSPRWSPDGQSFVYSRRDINGETSIERLYVGTDNVKTYLKSDANNLFPVWSPDGSHIIYSSDKTGVFNLYAYSLSENEVYQITHLPGGAFHPDVSSNKIYFSNYSSKGFHIVEMPYAPSSWTTDIGPYIQISWNKQGERDEAGAVRKQLIHTNHKIKKYDPKGTLLPEFWLPFISYDDEGAIPGVFTIGHDVLGYHTYILRAGHGVSGRTYFDLNYLYDRWKPSFIFRGYSHPVYYSDLFANGSGYYERSSGAGLEDRYPLPMRNLESSYTVKAGLNIEKVSHLTEFEGRRVEKYEIFEGRKDSIYAGFSYNGALRYPLSISLEDGREISVLFRNYIKGPDHREYLLDYKEYIGRSSNQTIYMNLRMAFSEGDHTAQQAFQIGGVPYGQNRYPLRGFPSNFDKGDHVVTYTLEYRFPLWYIFRGWNSKPVYLDRFHAALFAETGNAWGADKDSELNDFSAGIGAEARMDTVLGYKVKITPALGIAQGLTDGGETQVYFIIYVGL